MVLVVRNAILRSEFLKALVMCKVSFPALCTLPTLLNTQINGRREKEEQEYYHKRKEAYKIIGNKKNTYMKSVIELIEEDKKHNNTRKIYQTVNQFKKGY